MEMHKFLLPMSTTKGMPLALFMFNPHPLKFQGWLELAPRYIGYTTRRHATYTPATSCINFTFASMSLLCEQALNANAKCTGIPLVSH